MRIAILIEGKTEQALNESLLCFLANRLPGVMPKLDFVPYDGRIPVGERLRREVERLLLPGPRSADVVIALTDVYTGTADFLNANDAKAKMSTWVGSNARFHPHVALHEFEAWLLPFWPKIQRLAGHNRTAPGGSPEAVNHDNPPSRRIAEIFRIGSRGRCYVKTRDAKKILQNEDLVRSIRICPEFKAFVNKILHLSGAITLA